MGQPFVVAATEFDACTNTRSSPEVQHHHHRRNPEVVMSLPTPPPIDASADHSRAEYGPPPSSIWPSGGILCVGSCIPMMGGRRRISTTIDDKMSAPMIDESEGKCVCLSVCLWLWLWLSSSYSSDKRLAWRSQFLQLQNVVNSCGLAVVDVGQNETPKCRMLVLLKLTRVFYNTNFLIRKSSCFIDKCKTTKCPYFMTMLVLNFLSLGKAWIRYVKCSPTPASV